MIIIKNFLPTDAGLFSIFLKSLCYCLSFWLLKYSFFKNGHSFIHFMFPDRIRFYKTDNFPLSHRQYQLLMHIIFLCKIPIARFRWQLQYSRLLQLVHWGKMNWKVQYLMGECDTLGKEMTQLTEDKFLSVLGLSIHKQVNLSSQVIMIQTIITSMTKQIRMKS